MRARKACGQVFITISRFHCFVFAISPNTGLLVFHGKKLFLLWKRHRNVGNGSRSEGGLGLPGLHRGADVAAQDVWIHDPVAIALGEYQFGIAKNIVRG
jgi:hypothetical protein